MELQVNESPAVRQLTGEVAGITIAPGQQFRIETSPEGIEILNVVVPAGKRWVVGISVDVRVTDV